MAIPNDLAHKPIIAVDNYERIDGQYANSSDARCISIGQAQYNKNEISLKVFRHSGEKWKRSSEELPVHRVFDLGILAVASFLANEETNYANSNLGEEIVERDRISELVEYYKQNRNIIRPRLKELKRVLELFLEKNE